MSADLQVLKLSKSFGVQKVFTELSFTSCFGDKIILVGANGSGKSTLLKILVGLLASDSGECLYQKQSKVPHSDLAYLGETLGLYLRLTVIENIEFFAKLRDCKIDMEESLESFGLKEHRNHSILELSKGLQARVALALSFMHKPRFILLDEPSSFLDATGVSLLVKSLTKLEEYHSGQLLSIIATHDLHRLSSYANRALVLSEGQLKVDQKLSEQSKGELVALYQELNR